MLILFKSLTNDGERDVMEGTMKVGEECSEEEHNCGTEWSKLFMLTFIVINIFVFMKMF
jgi:hypothetical protein